MSQEVSCESCESTFTRIIKSGGRLRLCETCRNERQKARCRAYKQKNKDKISAYNSTYKGEHKEEISVYNKEYDKQHRDVIQERQNQYQKNRRLTDPAFKAVHYMRTRMNKLMNGQKINSTLKLLGCSKDDFVQWIKFQLTGDMTMENHGSVWHYDHVIPCSLFDQNDQDEREKCWHWSNIQPMLGSDNMSKQNRISKAEIIAHEAKIKKFIDDNNEKISEEMTLLEYDRVSYSNC